MVVLRGRDVDDADRRDLERYHKYCNGVRVALGMDIVELERGDPRMRMAAADRFNENVAGHSWQEIQLCAVVSPDLSRRDDCRLTDDYQCLARLAQQAMESIPIQLPPKDD
jgi:hypothetical protein